MSDVSTTDPTTAVLDEKRLPFVDHLRELRTRTVRSVVYVTIAFFVAWAYHPQLYAWLVAPYMESITELQGADQALAFRGLIEPIAVYLKVALLFGAIAAAPFVLLEAWLFVAPGLYKSERSLALPFLVASVFCFVGGALFCRYVVLPPANYVLLEFGGAGATPLIMMTEYFSFTSRMLFVFGALFELPVAVSFLALLGLVNHGFLIKHWRIAIVLAFVVGGILTPPDPFTQLLLAFPLVFLYGLSIVLAWMIGKRRPAKAAETAEAVGA